MLDNNRQRGGTTSCRHNLHDIVTSKLLNVATKKCKRLIVSPYIIWIFVALVWACSSEATTIVVFIDPAHPRIILGADGLKSIRYGVQQPTVSPEVCKIVKAADCAVALTGQASIDAVELRDNVPIGKLKYDLFDTARRACEVQGPLHVKADAFITMSRKVVEQAASFLQVYAPDMYEKVKVGEFICAIFVGVENGKLVMFVRGFRIADSGSLQPFSYIRQRGSASMTYAFAVSMRKLTSTSKHTQIGKGSISLRRHATLFNWKFGLIRMK